MGFGKKFEVYVVSILRFTDICMCEGETDVFPLRYLWFSRSASLCLLDQLLGLIRVACEVFQTFRVYIVLSTVKSVIEC